MGTTFHGPSPWPYITATLRRQGPRHAAIAYLGIDAPDLLPLHAGDVLIVNAARAAVRAHATSPTALAHFVEKGVRVLSSPNLHANVITTPKQAIVGSASASHSSTIADEAVIITDDPETVTAARTFIDGIDEITVVDEVFIANTAAIWSIGRAVPLLGIGGRARTDHDFLPTPVDRMFLWHITDHQPGADETLTWAAHASLTASGPAAEYPLEWLRIDKPGGSVRGRLERGDLLLQVTADNTWIHPPAVVESDPISIPHSPHAVAFLLRTRADLQPLPVPEAETRLANLGHPDPGLHTDHRIISPGLRSALLRLWKL
ncbi:phosphatidylserine/phosphatidylglycerophosphate/cardiolipin synthase family protein [Rhodococcus sp. TAF43]|uniref:phosphatidylserine/phosphatidylglycerophosphate/ cardiolipin synthase family protein n=1 Tax=Rhodococcus sp. TAF43 TaxID=3237483 RepID=UPI003F96405A